MRIAAAVLNYKGWQDTKNAWRPYVAKPIRILKPI